MAIVIPDLFGAFQKGREYAIDRNWKDLENYETIEKMRTANDMAQLALLQERAYTPGKINMFYDNVDNSAMQNQIQFTAYPGALSNARQFTNQAISAEGVQAATLPSTAQAQVATTLANNRVAMGEATEKNAYAENTDWGGKGKANAAVTNFKAGKALSNAELDQVVFELQRAVQKGEAGKVLFELGLDKATRPQQEELARLVADGKIEEAKQYLVNLRNGTPTGTGNNGQAIKFVNPAFKDRDDLDLANMAAEIDELERKYPNASEEAKVGWNDRRRAIREEQKARGIKFPSEQQVERGSISFITNAYDNRLPMFRNAVPLTTQQVANQPQDLTGGGQPQQTQATSLVKSIEDNPNLAPAVKNVRKNYAILDESGGPGLFGETDINPSTPLIRIGNRQVGVSLQTLKVLNDVKEIENLTPNQLLLYNSLLLNPNIKKVSVKDKNGNERLKFDPLSQPALIPTTNYADTTKYPYRTSYGGVL